MSELKRKNWFCRLCEGGLLWIACLACGILLGLNLLYRVEITEGMKEQVRIFPEGLRGLCMLGLTAVLTIGAGFLPKPDKLKESTCFAVLCVIYTVMGLYLVLNTDSALREDAEIVYRAAQAFRQGDYQALEVGRYISYNPHQTGLMLYDALIYSLSGDPRIGVAANFCFVLGIQYLVWRMTNAMFHSREVNLTAMGLSFAFLPQFFFILFLYGTIPSFFFLMLAFYQTIRFSQEGRLGQLLTAGLSIGVSVILRKNNIIGGAAMVIFLLLRWLEQPKKGKWLAAACLAAVLAVAPSQLMLLGVEVKTGCDLHRGIPNILYIQMGTNIENHRFGPGWWDGSNLQLFVDSNFDPEMAAEEGRWFFRENLKKMEAKPYNAARFFYDKVTSTWCDPLYQSLWSGPLEDRGQMTHTALLQSIYGGGRAWSAVEAFCKWLTLTLWAFALAYLLVFRRGQIQWQLCYLYTIGGALFHFVWETKSQYVYPYVFCLIPFAACALTASVQRFRRKK